MMKTACFILSLPVSLSLWAADSDGLLQAHLDQAHGISASAANGAGTDAALAALKAEIAEKLAIWSARVERRDLGDDALLAGIPKGVLEEARQIGANTVKAQDALKKSVTLELVLSLVAVRNPDVRAAYENLRATLRHYEQASYLEDLSTRYRAFVRELDTKVGPQSHKEMPGKTFAFPSVLALKGQVVDAEAEIARLDYMQALRKALNQIADEFFEIQSMAHELDILEQNRELLAKSEASTRSQLETGKISQSDLLKVQANLANLDDEIEILRHHRLHHEVQINVLLALPPITEWGPFYETDLRVDTRPEEALLALAQAQNQELLKSERDVAMQETMVRLSETMLYPRASGMSQIALSMGAEAGPTRNAMTTFPERPAVTQEAGTFGADAAYIDELRVRARGAKEQRDGVLAKIHFMVDHAFFSLHVAVRNTATYADVVVPKAKQSYEVLKKRYASADAAYAEVFDAGRSYLDDEKMLNDHRRDRNKALVDVQDSIGRTAAALLPAIDYSKARPIKPVYRSHPQEHPQ